MLFDLAMSPVGIGITLMVAMFAPLVITDLIAAFNVDRKVLKPAQRAMVANLESARSARIAAQLATAKYTAADPFTPNQADLYWDALAAQLAACAAEELADESVEYVNELYVKHNVK